MESSFLECDVCRESFNTSNKAPHILCCGHTFCKQCINMIRASPFFTLRCPTCRKESSDSTINYMILKQLNAKVPLKCQTHNKDLDLLCKNCEKSICSKCEKESHKGHETVFWDDLLVAIKKKFSESDEFVKIYNRQKKLFETIRDTHHGRLNELITTKITLMMGTLEDLQLILLEEVGQEIDKITFTQFFPENSPDLENLIEIKTKYERNLSEMNPKQALSALKFDFPSEIKTVLQNLHISEVLKEKLEAIKILWPKFDIEGEVKIVSSSDLKLKKNEIKFQDDMIRKFYSPNSFGICELNESMIKFAMNACRFPDLEKSSVLPQNYYDLIYTNLPDPENLISIHKGINQNQIALSFNSIKVISFLGSNSKYQEFGEYLNSDLCETDSQRLAIKVKSKKLIIDVNSFDQKTFSDEVLPLDPDAMNKIMEDIILEFSNIIVLVIQKDSVKDLDLLVRIQKAVNNKDQSRQIQLVIIHDMAIKTTDELNDYKIKLERNYPGLSLLYEANEFDEWVTYYKVYEYRSSTYHFIMGVPGSDIGKKNNNFTRMMLDGIVKNSTSINASCLPDKIMAQINHLLKPEVKKTSSVPEKIESSVLMSDKSFLNEISFLPTLGFRLSKRNKYTLVMEIETIGASKFRKIIRNLIKGENTFTIRVSLSRWFDESEKKTYIQDTRRKDIFEIETEPLRYSDFNDINFNLMCEPYYDLGWVVLTWGTESQPVIDLL